MLQTYYIATFSTFIHSLDPSSRRLRISIIQRKSAQKFPSGTFSNRHEYVITQVELLFFDFDLQTLDMT